MQQTSILNLGKRLKETAIKSGQIKGIFNFRRFVVNMNINLFTINSFGYFDQTLNFIKKSKIIDIIPKEHYFEFVYSSPSDEYEIIPIRFYIFRIPGGFSIDSDVTFIKVITEPSSGTLFAIYANLEDMTKLC